MTFQLALQDVKVKCLLVTFCQQLFFILQFLLHAAKMELNKLLRMKKH